MTCVSCNASVFSEGSFLIYPRHGTYEQGPLALLELRVAEPDAFVSRKVPSVARKSPLGGAWLASEACGEPPSALPFDPVRSGMKDS